MATFIGNSARKVREITHIRGGYWNEEIEPENGQKRYELILKVTVSSGGNGIGKWFSRRRRPTACHGHVFLSSQIQESFSIMLKKELIAYFLFKVYTIAL